MIAKPFLYNLLKNHTFIFQEFLYHIYLLIILKELIPKNKEYLTTKVKQGLIFLFLIASTYHLFNLYLSALYKIFCQFHFYLEIKKLLH